MSSGEATVGAGESSPSMQLLADLEKSLGVIFSRKRERPTTGGQIVGHEVWRTEFSGLEYWDMRDKLDALRTVLTANK